VALHTDQVTSPQRVLRHVFEGRAVAIR
jgi:hypothetical protein